MSVDDTYENHCPYCPKKDNSFKEQCAIYRCFDDVLEAVRPFGSYQIFVCAMILASSLMWAGNYAFDVFALMEPTWRCQIASPLDGTLVNMTPLACVNNCSKLVPVHRYFSGVVEQWRLVCERRWIPSVIVIVPEAVMFIGSIFAGHFHEWYGRKNGLSALQFGLCVSSVLTICSRSWVALLVFRCISLFFWSCINITLRTLSMEYTSTKYRIIPACCFQWSLAYMFVSLIAYLTKSWSMYLIIANVVTSPVLLGFLVFLESPRWLIQQNRLEDAGRVLSDIGSSRWNKSILTILKQQLEDIKRPAVPQKYSAIHLFSRKPPLLKVTLIQLLAMLTYSFTKNAYVLKTSILSFNPFLSVAIYGGLRIWVPFLLIFLDRKFENFGRKTMFLGSLSIMIIAYTIALALHAAHVKQPAYLEMIFVLIGTCTAVSAFDISINLITFEYYPTCLRNIALGTFYAVDYLGTLVMLALMSQNNDTNLHAQAFGIVSHSMAVIIALVTLILGYFWQVETKHLKLKESLSDYEGDT